MIRRFSALLFGLVLFGCGSRGKSGGSSGSDLGSAAAPQVGSGADSTAVGSGSAGSGSKAAGSAAAAAAPMAPAAAEAKAREILGHQIDATKSGGDAIRQTFTDDAIVFTEGKATTTDLVTFYGLADGGPDGVQTDKATIAKLMAGGNADAVWFYAEVATENSVPSGGKETATTRVVEVASAAQQWKVVAASFGEAHALHGAGSNREIQNATAADGPLAKLLAAPGTVAAQLAPDAIVVGPTAATQGGSAKDALASWKLDPISVYQRAREVRTATWGFVQANLDHPDGTRTDRLAGLLVAVPGAGDAWTIVLAEYVSR